MYITNTCEGFVRAILGAFAKFLKATTGFVMLSVRLPVRPHGKIRLRQEDFSRNFVFEFPRKLKLN
jgi:hypothetical protein